MAGKLIIYRDGGAELILEARDGFMERTWWGDFVRLADLLPLAPWDEVLD